MREERGVSSVVGIVLILAITLAMVTSLMVVGALALSETQDDTQLSQMETSMAQMSSKASLTALGGSEVQRFELGRATDGTVEVDPDAGALKLEWESDDGNETDTLYETDSFGAVIYTQGDSEVAFQGGGVWKRTGDDGGSMVSPPEYHYLSDTLTFPVIRVEGDARARGDVRGTIEHQESSTIFPSENFSNPIENGSVFVEIESEYHQGWFDFFDSRTTGEVIHDPENQRVRMDLTVPFENEFSTGVSVQESVEDYGNANVSSAQEGQEHRSATHIVDNQFGDADNQTPEFEGPGTYAGNETYIANESVIIDDTVTFNTTDGDIKVLLEDGYETDGTPVIEVEGPNDVEIFTRGQIDFGNARINQEGNASQMVVYIHSDVDETVEAGNLEMKGVIYAPNTDLYFHGNIEFEGAIVASSFEARGNAQISYDPELDGQEFGVGDDGDVIRFIHVTENVVEVDTD